jgi:hypothetical protein
MRAINDHFDLSALLRQQITKSVVHCVEVGGRQKTPRQAGLIRRYSDSETGVGEPRDSIDAPRQGNPLVNRLDEVLGILVDHSVPVQNN